MHKLFLRLLEESNQNLQKEIHSAYTELFTWVGQQDAHWLNPLLWAKFRAREVVAWVRILRNHATRMFLRGMEMAQNEEEVRESFRVISGGRE